MSVSRRALQLALTMISLAVTPGTELGAQVTELTSEDSTEYELTRRLFSVELRLSGVYDSNVNHNEDDINSGGYLLGGVVGFRSSPSRPLLTLSYRGQKRQFSGTDRWDRMEHEVRAQLAKRVGPFSLDLTGEVDLRGATEDRELGNQYTTRPRLAISFGPARIRTHVAYRLRRLEETSPPPPDGPPDTAEEETYMWGAELRLRPADPHTFELEYRYEDSRSEDPRRRYIRHRYVAGYEVDFGGAGLLAVEVQYRPRYFPDLEAPEDPSAPDAYREDIRWIPSVRYEKVFPAGHEIQLEYEYQHRTSNVPDEAFEAHRLSLTWHLPLLSPFRRTPIGP